MKEHELRVVKELDELEEKYAALGEFIRGGIFKKLSAIEQDLLNRQRDVMFSYILVLAERIKVFQCKNY